MTILPVPLIGTGPLEEQPRGDIFPESLRSPPGSNDQLPAAVQDQGGIRCLSWLVYYALVIDEISKPEQMVGSDF